MTIVGLGLVTYARPEMAALTFANIACMLGDDVQHFVHVNDGCPPEMRPAFEAASVEWPGVTVFAPHRGVAAAKNEALDLLLDRNCTDLFVMEDDLAIDSPAAVTEYVRIATAAGVGHLAWARQDAFRLRRQVGEIKAWSDHCGTFAYFSADAVERVRLPNGQIYDEDLICAFEHVELAMRLYRSGAFPLELCWPDAAGSENWMHDRRLTSSINADPSYAEHHIPKMRAVWKAKANGPDQWVEINAEADALP